MGDLVLYGLKSCDTCRKALGALEAAGRQVRFVDIRSDADLAAKVPIWLEAIAAEVLVNKRSTTWRGLSDGERAEADDSRASALLIAHPTLIKRPVIEADGKVYVGWGVDVSGVLLK